MKIKEAVQYHNIISQVVSQSGGSITGGLDWAYFQLSKEVQAIQEHAKISEKDPNELLKEIGDKPSQVRITLSPADLPDKCPAGLSQALQGIMETPEFKDDYYASLTETKKTKK